MTIDPGDPRFLGINYARAADLDWSAALPANADIAEDSPRPDLPREAVVRMSAHCELPEALLGGNLKMCTERWLPCEEEESEENHRVRLARSTCFPFYKDTLLDLVARPFIRSLAWEQDPPDVFAEFLRDVDGTGKDLTVFARECLFYAMHRGMDHVLVDASGNSGDTRQATDNRRVYAQRISSLSMLDIRDTPDPTGRKRVVYCRFVMGRVLNTNEFKRTTETVIVELAKEIGEKPGTKVEWRFNATAKKWVAGPSTPYNPGKNGIPVFTLYTQQVGEYEAEPLHEDLAWVNLAHFQSRSDHAHVMRIARLITLVTLGFATPDRNSPLADKAMNDRIVLGPFSRISTQRPPKDASVAFLEPSGKSIELSFQDMEQLADECKRLGARHLTSNTGNVTARAVTSDDQRASNSLQALCLRDDVLLRQICEAVAEWLNAGELPAKVQPRTYKEFPAAGNIEGGSKGLQAIAPALSKKQLLTEAVRYGILRPDFPIDENLADLEKEQQAVDAAIAAAAGTPGGHDHPPADGGGNGDG